MTALTLKKLLTSKAQFYLGFVELSGKIMLPLSPIEWGQRYVTVQVTESGKFDHFGIYDRADGGDPLEVGPFTQGVLELEPGARVECTVTWTNKVAPLESMATELEVTPGMIEAGILAYYENSGEGWSNPGEQELQTMLRRVFQAMWVRALAERQ